VKEYGHLISWEGITSVVLVMVHHQVLGIPGMMSFSPLIGRPINPGMWGAQQTTFGGLGC